MLVESRQEFVAGEVFAAQDPVGVADADLDVLYAAVGQEFADVGIVRHG